MFKCVPILNLVTLVLMGVYPGLIQADVAYRITSPTQSAVAAKVIVLGEVKSIEKDLVEVSRYPKASKDTPKLAYRVAVVKISEALVGAKGLTEVRVGFYPSAVSFEGRSNRRPFVSGPPIPELKVGDQGYFMLTPHFEGDFYIYAGNFPPGPLLTKDPQAEKEVPKIKKVATIMKDPVSYLTSKDQTERFMAVAILAKRYRVVTNPEKSQEVEIPKEETQMILNVILEVPYMGTEDGLTSKAELFGLFLSEDLPKIGFRYPMAKPGENVSALQEKTINEFLKANREKIILKKWVSK